MNENDKNADQNEESPLPFSLELELIASLLGIIADAISVWAVLEAIEEANIAEEQEIQNQNGLDVKLQEMQAQIDQLTEELANIKKT
ncbi:hypothetical protein J2Z83_003478 [Virgibacillus natechei]|uniref:Uncharacterized protein n=1 Tax=Virgibacillus natechei TaxID=1216297 RepID=A0ABS4IKA1_9BACI|nr:hypothetical protein [Virgibacillus natechei]MBP1971339.1 hypothetical protein [Virgibacillus natechei]UZD12926.1 hypothetical protein OLD84_18920 [Virgibacillus natechei]